MLSFVIVKNMFLLLIYFSITIILKISTQRSKQDFIRLRSKPVADILKNNTSSYTRYKKEMVIDNVKVDDKVCEIISEIMDESYTDIQILTHKLYSKGDDIKASKTIWMKNLEKNIPRLLQEQVRLELFC